MIDVKFGNIDKRVWLAGAAFLLILAVLGLRSRQAAHDVLSSRDDGAVPVVAAGGDPHGLLGLARRDSLVRNAEAKRANPFHNPTIVREIARPTVKNEPTPAPTKPAEPKLLTLLHDDVSPCVQINVGGERSGWLHRGDSFQGWSVGEIARESVTVAKGGRTLVLR